MTTTVRMLLLLVVILLSWCHVVESFVSFPSHHHPVVPIQSSSSYCWILSATSSDDNDNKNDDDDDNNLHPLDAFRDPRYNAAANPDEDNQKESAWKVDPLRWTSSSSSNDMDDWEAVLKAKQDGSYWKTFESLDDDEDNDDEEDLTMYQVADDNDTNNDNDAEAWLDALQAIQADEMDFTQKDRERADTVRKMQELGLSQAAIQNTLQVAVQEEPETPGMQSFERGAYYNDGEDIDWKTVESHTKVETDEDGEPIRQQMVYVDEHTCIGCTNCAMIAQSTFYMNEEHGRARVFQQWGDDDETIQIAIETCPVDCIHYVPYDELVKLEVERRDQNINFKARLVSQAEYGGLGLSHAVGGPNAFTAPQEISGNLSARCNNCPSRGCANCPMFGVGKNPAFERKEKERKAKMERRRLEAARKEENKSVDL